MQSDQAGQSAPGQEPIKPFPGLTATTRKTLGLRKRFEDFETAPPAKPPSPEVQAQALRGRRLGEILVAMGVLTEAQVLVSAEEARLAKERIGQYLLRRHPVTPQQLCRALSLQSGLPVVEFPNSNLPVAAKYARLLDTMTRFELVPFSETDDVLCVAAKRPPSPQRVPEIETAFGKRIRVCLAPDEQIAAALQTLGVGKRQQDRRHRRYKITMPCWLQLCGERNETLGPKLGCQILDVSLGGLKVEAPENAAEQIQALRRAEPRALVRFSTPPLEVHGSCVVRYLRKADKPRSPEKVCLLGLEIKTLGPTEEENFRQLHERAVIATQRYEREFGEDNS